MFARDLYQQDFVNRYFPKYSVDSFEKDMFHPSKRLLHSVLLTSEEQTLLKRQTIRASFMTIGSLVGSIGVIFLYNRIPLIRRVQKRWKRVTLKGLIVIVPYVLGAMYSNFENVKFLLQCYEKFKGDYQVYKQEGDVKVLNPKIVGKNIFFFYI